MCIRDRAWFAYNAHPWYALATPQTETYLFEGLYARGVRVNMLFGNGTYLDRRALKLVKAKGYRARIAQQHALPRDAYIVWVCGPYVVECAFPPEIAKRFAVFFNTVHNLRDFDHALFLEVFRKKVRCHITLRKAPERAEELRKKMELAMGLEPATY